MRTVERRGPGVRHQQPEFCGWDSAVFYVRNIFETTDGKYDGFPRASQKMLWRKTDQISISETAVTKGIQDGFVILLFVCILWRKHEISDLIWLSKHKSEIPSSWYAWVMLPLNKYLLKD